MNPLKIMGDRFYSDWRYRKVVLINQGDQIDIARKCFEDINSHQSVNYDRRFFEVEVENLGLRLLYSQNLKEVNFHPDEESVLTIVSRDCPISTYYPSSGLLGFCCDEWGSGVEGLDRTKNEENLEMQRRYGQKLKDIIHALNP